MRVKARLTRSRGLVLGTAIACVLGLNLPAVAVGGPSPSPRSSSCVAPAKRVTYSKGSATAKVASGPQAGSHAMTHLVDARIVKSSTQIARSGGLKISGFWESKTNMLSLVLVTRTGCKPMGAYLELDFIDADGGYHVYSTTKACSEKIGKLSPTGLSGAFTCATLKLTHGQAVTAEYPSSVSVKGSFSLAV